MIILEREQGTPEWFAARRGIPTASGFDSIITASGKPSKSAETYRNKLLAEWLLGDSVESFESPWMARGKEYEAEARDAAAFILGREITPTGFILHDSREYGCSPDGLIGDSGIEIKCPAAHTQIGYLMYGGLPSAYVPQVQGSMAVTGAREWWFFSYYPGLPPVLARVARDDNWQELFAVEMAAFIRDLNNDKEKLREFK
jgi:hypothetical protein